MARYSPRAEGANGFASGQRGSVGRPPARRLEATRTERAASSKYSRGHHFVVRCRVASSGSSSKSVGPLNERNRRKEHERGVGVQGGPYTTNVWNQGLAGNATIMRDAGVCESRIAFPCLAGIRRSVPRRLIGRARRSAGGRVWCPEKFLPQLTPPPFSSCSRAQRRQRACAAPFA